MKKLAFAALFALAACSPAEQASETVTEEPVVTEALAPMSVDGGPMVGTYEATSNDGIVLIQTLSEDGTVTSSDADGNVVNGTYTGSAEQFCITNEGESEAACFAYGELGEDGSWTATNEADPTEVWTIRRSS